MKALNAMLSAALIAASTATLAQDDMEATFETTSITPEAAYKAARAALESCREAGYQVTVTVVDKAALPVVLLRDRLAGFHTVEVAMGKARTAVSFKGPTAGLVESTKPGAPESAIRLVPGVTVIAGGLPIEAAGSIVGGIGVSGAPGGDKDEACAADGLEAIAMDLAF
jgi:uncharacterized protein GlcG (DUF336 family)